MYWYLDKPEDRPAAVLKQVARLDYDGKLSKMDPNEKVKIARQLVAWEQAQGRNFYRPNDKAYWFFLQPHFIKWIFGGNRSGKTATCVMELLMQCEGWHPLQRENLEKLVTESWDDNVKRQCEDLLKRKKWIRSVPVTVRVVAVDFPNGVEKFVGPEYRKWWTRADIKYDGIDNEKKRRVEWKNGSVLEFMSLDQDLDAHGGTSRDAIHFDEEPTSEHYQENLMRVLSSQGRIIGGMTAVKGITWIKDQIWDKFEKGDKDIYAIKMRTEDNPIISSKTVKVIMEQCIDKDEIEIRLHGEFKARGGLVFKEYRDRTPWVVDPFAIPEEKGYLILAIDPHTRTDHAALWTWVDTEGSGPFPLKNGKPNLYEVAEYFRGGTIPEFSNDLKMIEMRLGRKHDLALCDPSAWTGDQRDDNTRTTVEQFTEAGIYPIKGSKDLQGGIHKTRELMLVTGDGDKPRLMTFNSLERTRWETTKYRYPDMRGRLRDEKAGSERPLDKDDHMMENRRRIVEFVFEGNFEVIEPVDPLPQVNFKPIIINGKTVDVSFDEVQNYGGITNAYLGV